MNNMCSFNKLRLTACFLFLFVQYIQSNTCHKTAIITRSISQNGFHRMLETIIEIPWNLTGSMILLEEKLPAGVYVDPDELERIKDTSSTTACVLDFVNVETFHSNSHPHRVYVYSKPLCQDQKEVIIQIPIHVRYHKASLGGINANVYLPQPSLLASIPSNSIEEITHNTCAGWSDGPAPCPHCSTELCDWIHLPYSSAQLELTLDVPVGNIDHAGFVLVGTAFTLILATLYLLWTLQKSAKKNR